MISRVFTSADILIPKKDFEKWAVVACDQFTSEPEYWNRADSEVGCYPSSLRITLPEIYLTGDIDGRIADINSNMEKYIDEDVFNTYKDAMIYIERTLPDGSIRRGIVGAIDLEAYDYNKGAVTLIRATEGTVLERIPPRVKIRENASLEIPHVMLLIDDDRRTVIEPLSDSCRKLLYDFDLMLGGGHIRGYLVSREEQERICNALEALKGNEENPLLFAVGDGNHSLATAKACYKANPSQLNRYALAEIVNIHDEALEFEPIYRVMFNVDTDDVIKSMKEYYAEAGTQELEYVAAGTRGKIMMKPATALPVGTVQAFIDDYIKSHSEAKVDYIHGVNVVEKLSESPNTIGFIFKGMEKSELFASVKADGALPRKTFSMGEAAGKRYYMEARKIK